MIGSSRNIICIGRPKLMFTDGILPLLVELKDRYPQSKIHFLIFTQEDLDLLKKNQDIWDTFKHIDCTPKLIPVKNPILFRLIYLFFFLLQIFNKKNTIIMPMSFMPLHKVVKKLLKKFSDTTIIRHYHHASSSEVLQHDVTYLRMWNGRHQREWEFKGFEGDFDYHLSPLSEAQYAQVFLSPPPVKKLIYSGFCQHFKAWQTWIKKKSEENTLIQEEPYMFFVLSHLSVSRDKLDEPTRDILLEESLEVLKKYEKSLKVVLKPHPNINLKELETILDKSGLTNYVIDYSHPMVLASKALFLLGNAFSTVMYDACFYGRTIVEYSHRDPELVSLVGNWSTGDKCCDFFFHHDKEALEQCIQNILEGSAEIDRSEAFMDKHFPPTPEEFFNFWDKRLL